MPLLRRHDDGLAGHRFQMREKLASIGDDSWIDRGDRVYKVNGKALRVRDTFLLEDRNGNQVAKIQEKKVRVRDTMQIERDGRAVATMHKALVGIRDRFTIDVEGAGELKARGNVVDHEYGAAPLRVLSLNELAGHVAQVAAHRAAIRVAPTHGGSSGLDAVGRGVRDAPRRLATRAKD